MGKVVKKVFLEKKKNFLVSTYGALSEARITELSFYLFILKIYTELFSSEKKSIPVPTGYAMYVWLAH